MRLTLFTGDFDDDEYFEDDDIERRRRRLSSGNQYCYIKVGERYCLPAIVPFDENCLECDGDNSLECNNFDLVSVCLFSSDYRVLLDLPMVYIY